MAFQLGGDEKLLTRKGKHIEQKESARVRVMRVRTGVPCDCAAAKSCGAALTK